MTQIQPLADLFHVGARFYRSVNIVADYDDPDALTDYILSPLGRTVLTRIVEGLKSGSRGRAWSIVGPYGAGKSAFALFLGNVLGYPRNDIARGRLRAAALSIYDELCNQIPGWSESGYVVVPIVGSHEPLAPAVLRGLAASLVGTPVHSRQSEELLEYLGSLRQEVELGNPLSGAMLSRAVEATARAVRAAPGGPLGLLVVVDELGKLLEHAALHPAQGDIFLLQTLAELAARSGDNAIGLVVVLHQAFERYATRLSPSQQQEWAKVQGWFENIALQEPPDQHMRLVVSAIERFDDQAMPPVLYQMPIYIGSALESGWLPPLMRPKKFTELCLGAYPLHPTAFVALPHLFRRPAQDD